MTNTAPLNWHEANQRYLMARLSVVREALTRHANRNATKPATTGADATNEEPNQLVEKATRDLPASAALDSLCSVFGLSAFERDLLLLCAGVELDSTFADLCARAQGDPPRHYPTFSLALAALPDPHWNAIIPAGPLRRWRFIEMGLADSLTNCQLRIDERVLHYLTGVSCLDARLQGLVELIPRPVYIAASHRLLAQQIARIWALPKDGPNWPIINLCGDDPVAQESVAAFTCGMSETQLYLFRAGDIPVVPAEREALARLWERETALSGSALLVDAAEVDNSRALTGFLENVRTMLFVSSREPIRLWRRRIIRFDVTKPGAIEQKKLWQAALGPAGAELDGHLELLVSQFSLGAQAIQAASSVVAARMDIPRPPETSGPAGTTSNGGNGIEAAAAEIETKAAIAARINTTIVTPLWDACRTQARSRLDDLAQRIEPVARWSDLVVPDSQRQILRDMTAHLRHRSQVYQTWGFASKGARGLGLSALFAGASGTGKTMAAEVLANELRLDLYRIDLSQVVSKYIGETEKNLRRVFDAAEEGGAILLFDEADALFGKRTEVRDSHDRYANIEVSYLLQRMENYSGLAILTTNMKSALDNSFLRRLRFIVHFPFPDTYQRAEIWRRVFPQSTPTQNLDANKLARLNIAGGNIRNIAVHSAFLAAEAREPVQMLHLLQAARSEYAKLEKTLTDTETAHWL